MILFDHVSKAYPVRGGRKIIIEDLTFQFPAGIKLGLLGRNGSGKSTLLKLIAGTTEPDSGVIHRDTRISWPLGFAGGFHPALTGRQNTRFIARIYGIDTEELVAFAEEFSELGAYFDMAVSTYSAGMKARLAFGASIGVSFDMYLVDEITAVGDAGFRNKCITAFKEILSVAGLLMVSHNMNTIRDFCDCGAVMDNGTFHFFDDVEEAIAHYLRYQRAS